MRTGWFHRSLRGLQVGWWVWLCTAVCAADELKPTVITEGLNSPWGVAVQLGTNLPFVAESGRGRVIRVVDGAVQEVVTGFPVVPLDGETRRPAGPMSLAFLTPSVLVVGTAGADERQNGIYIINVPPAGHAPVNVSDALRLPQDRPASSRPGEFHWDAVTAISASLDGGIFALIQSHDPLAAIIHYPIRQTDQLQRGSSYGRPLFAAAESLVPASGRQPWSISRNSRGEVLIGYPSFTVDPTAPHADSEIRFLRAVDGQPIMALAVKLPDLVAVQFVQFTANKRDDGQLLALDSGWSHGGDGGIFRLDATLVAGRPSVQAIRLAGCAQPVSFAPGSQEEAAIYVVTWGDSGGASNGKLLRYTLHPSGP